MLGNAEDDLSALTCQAETSSVPEFTSLVIDGVEEYVNDFSTFRRIVLAVLAAPAIGSLDARAEFTERLSNSKSAKQCSVSFAGGKTVVVCHTCRAGRGGTFCISCFESVDHRGHDYLVVNSDMADCICGDPSRCKRSAFCPQHPGRAVDEDPSAELEEWTRMSASKVINGLLAAAIRFSALEATAQQVQDILKLVEHLTSLHDGLRRIVCRELLEDNHDSTQGTLEVSKSSGSYVDLVFRFEEPGSQVPEICRHLWWLLLISLDVEERFAVELAPVLLRNYTGIIRGRLVRRESLSALRRLGRELFDRPDVALSVAQHPESLITLLSTESMILEGSMLGFVPGEVDSGPIHGILLTPESEESLAQERFMLQPAAPSAAAERAKAAGMRIFNSCNKQCCDLLQQIPEEHIGALLSHRAALDAIMGGIGEIWPAWLDVLGKLQFMNPHRRRPVSHTALHDTLFLKQAALIGGVIEINFWVLRGHLMRRGSVDGFERIVPSARDALKDWHSRFDPLPDNVHSFHTPLNHVLAMGVMDLVRLSCKTPADLNRVLLSALPGEQDVERLMLLPLRALRLQTEVTAGLWAPNGADIEHEDMARAQLAFGRCPAAIDAMALRLGVLHPFNQEDKFRRFFHLLISVFRISHEDEELEIRLTGFLRIVAELMAQQTELSLGDQELEELNIAQHLSWFPLSAQWLRGLAHPNLADTVDESIARVSCGAAGEKRELSDWTRIDLLSPLNSWRLIEMSENRLWEYLGDNQITLANWWKAHISRQPEVPQFAREAFQKFLSSELILAVIAFTLIRRPSVDSKSLKVAVHLVLRLCVPFGPRWRSALCDRPLSTPVAIPALSIEALAEAFRANWCHPWTVQFEFNGQRDSIFSRLRSLREIESSAQMKEWLTLALDQISIQCVHTKTPDSATLPSD